MKIILENVSANREEWLKLKENTIGSSEIATICGVNEFQTSLELWARKTQKIPPQEATIPMRMGTMFEPVIGELFAIHNQVKVHRANIMAVHEVHSWASASPDFFLSIETEPEALETKFTTWRNRHIWDHGIPSCYLIQTNWQMGVCGIKRGHVAGLVGDDFENLRGDQLPFSPELFEFCLEQAHAFMELVRTDTPPLAQGDDFKLLTMLQGDRVDQEIDLPDKSIEWANEFERLNAERKVYEAKAKAMKAESEIYKSRLLQMMGNKNLGKIPDGRKVRTSLSSKKGFVMPESSWVNLKMEY
jgi:putative phage-type endonuclease